MRIALATWLLLAAVPQLASADEHPSPLDAAAEAPTKKHRELAVKQGTEPMSAQERARYHAVLDARIGKSPAPIINVFNTWTHEFLPVEAGRKEAQRGELNISKEEIDEFFRCHFTNQPTDMDPRLFQAIVKAAHHFVSPRIDIVSGFRSPKYNLILRKKGREVARNSQHTLGHAIDFRLRGVNIKKLEQWAKRNRLGGVGTYLRSRFVHIDVGPIRSWFGK